MSIPSDAAVKEAAETQLWTVYPDTNGIARAAFKHGREYVTIGAPVTATGSEPGRVFVYVRNGQVNTNVEILTFRYVAKDGTATDFRADGVRYAEDTGS